MCLSLRLSGRVGCPFITSFFMFVYCFYFTYTMRLILRLFLSSFFSFLCQRNALLFFSLPSFIRRCSGSIGPGIFIPRRYFLLFRNTILLFLLLPRIHRCLRSIGLVLFHRFFFFFLLFFSYPRRGRSYTKPPSVMIVFVCGDPECVRVWRSVLIGVFGYGGVCSEPWLTHTADAPDEHSYIRLWRFTHH